MKAILRLVFLNSFVMNFVSLRTYVKLAYFVFRESYFNLFPVLLNLFRIEMSYLLLHKICLNLSLSFYFGFGVYVVCFHSVIYLIAANLCSWGWHESFWDNGVCNCGLSVYIKRKVVIICHYGDIQEVNSFFFLFCGEFYGRHYVIERFEYVVFVRFVVFVYCEGIIY